MAGWWCSRRYRGRVMVSYTFLGVRRRRPPPSRTCLTKVVVELVVKCLTMQGAKSSLLLFYINPTSGRNISFVVYEDSADTV